MARVPFNLALYGRKVTNKFIKEKWGGKHPRGSFLLYTKAETYIDTSRINELENIENENFDLKKLVRLCEELNSVYNQKNYYATGMLVRAIIDHVPLVFGFGKFEDFANQYKADGTEKSFKKSMISLQSSMRNISDAYLHSPIRKKETLPNETQVDCKRDLDVLLAEVVRILK